MTFAEVFITFFGTIIGFILLSPLILGVYEFSRYLNRKIQYKKWRFHVSENYIVGFPSGEIMFIEDRDKFDILQNKRIIEWRKEYRCYCYLDHEKNYIKRIIKF